MCPGGQDPVLIALHHRHGVGDLGRVAAKVGDAVAGESLGSDLADAAGTAGDDRDALGCVIGRGRTWFGKLPPQVA